MRTFCEDSSSAGIEDGSLKVLDVYWLDENGDAIDRYMKDIFVYSSVMSKLLWESRYIFSLGHAKFEVMVELSSRQLWMWAFR